MGRDDRTEVHKGGQSAVSHSKVAYKAPSPRCRVPS